MLSTIFNSAFAELVFYLVCGGSIGILLTTLVWLTFRNRIIRKEVERRIPEITEEYRLYEAGAESIIEQYREEITRYKRIQAEMTVHASNLVKAIGS